MTWPRIASVRLIGSPPLGLSVSLERLSTAAIGRNVGHTCSTLPVQTELRFFPHPRPYCGCGGLSHPHPVNLPRCLRHPRRRHWVTIHAAIAHRFRVTVVAEAPLHQLAAPSTLADRHNHDITRILRRGIAKKSQHGCAENSSRNNRFRLRFDAITV